MVRPSAELIPMKARTRLSGVRGCIEGVFFVVVPLRESVFSVMDDRSRFGFLELRTERNDGEQVIALTGELDLDGTQRVSQELERAEAADVRRIVLDLSNLRFIDSSGVRLIVEADVRSRTEGATLALIRGPRPVHRVFELTGVAERLPFAD